MQKHATRLRFLSPLPALLMLCITHNCFGWGATGGRGTEHGFNVLKRQYFPLEQLVPKGPEL